MIKHFTYYRQFRDYDGRTFAGEIRATGEVITDKKARIISCNLRYDSNIINIDEPLKKTYEAQEIGKQKFLSKCYNVRDGDVKG